MNTPLTPTQVTACLDAKRMYFKARGALNQANRHIDFVSSYETLGKLPEIAFSDVIHLLSEANVYFESYRSMVAPLRAAGLSLKTIFQVADPAGPSEYAVAMQAFVSALDKVVALHTPAATQRMKAAGIKAIDSAIDSTD